MKLPNWDILIKQKNTSVSRKVALKSYRKLLLVIPATPPLFNSARLLSSAADKAKLFAKNFSRNSDLDDLDISLPIFSSRTHLKLHVSVTAKVVKMVITNLNLSKASGPDLFPVLVLKNCVPELLYILAELF